MLYHMLTDRQTDILVARFFRTAWVSRHQKGKPLWILMKKEMMGSIDISWAICRPEYGPEFSEILEIV